MRVSDAEREHVGELLQRAVGRGMLSLGEFTERMDTALAATTRGELNTVIVDLPGIRLAGPSQPDRAPASARATLATGAPPQTRADAYREVIRGRMGGVIRNGPWQVPSSLYLDDRFANVMLDFSQAVMRTQAVEIVIDDVCSSVTLIVPADTTVDLNLLRLVGSTATNQARSGPPLGQLHLAVRGRMRFGTVTARHA